MAEDFKVKLIGNISGLSVIFDAMPQIGVHHTAKYSPIEPSHLIGSYYVYDNSPSATYSLSDVKLISRNPKEAGENLKRILTLKSWTKSYFGKTDNFGSANDDLSQWLGSPPEVLTFSAYSTGDSRGHIYNIPVVLTSLDISYPNDVDYIFTGNDTGDKLNGTPFPSILTISLALNEQHSAQDYESFNLHKYRNGILDNF
jgi:hypothetical protein